MLNVVYRRCYHGGITGAGLAGSEDPDRLPLLDPVPGTPLPVAPPCVGKHVAQCRCSVCGTACSRHLQNGVRKNAKLFTF